MQRLKQLYDTLFGRTALVLTVTLILAHSLPILLFRLDHPRPMGQPEHEPLAARWLSEAESRRAIYASLPPASRNAFLAASADGPERLQLTAPAGFASDDGDDASQLQSLLAARLGPGTRLGHVEHPFRTHWLQFDIGGRPVWLTLPGPTFGRPEFNLQPLIWLTIAFAALGLAATLFLLWPLYRPLRQLAAAQAALGRGEPVSPLADTGPREVARLSASFNHMVNDLAALEDERRTLLTGVSHDLRTPLARLRMRLALLDSTDITPYERDVDDIERITEQFLAYVRGQSDDGMRESVDLAALTKDVADRYGTDAPLSIQTTARPTVLADALALFRALSNLIDNALAHGAAPVVLTVAIDGNDATVSVRDAGPGLPADMLTTAWRPFNRLDPARGGRGHCGLGLAIAQRVASRHGGRLVLENHPDGGLIATLRLPMTPAIKLPQAG
jgi:two-component system osmolarity sensor histidine kinase EnvZ